MMILMATVGAFVLALMAVYNANPLTIAVTVVYDIGVIMPLVWLAIKKG
jgi:hypothetical protein